MSWKHSKESSKTLLFKTNMPELRLLFLLRQLLRDVLVLLFTGLALTSVCWANVSNYQNKITTYYDDNESVLKVIRTYDQKRANTLGYYKTITHYGAKDRKEKLERFFIPSYAQQKEISNDTIYYTPDGKISHIESQHTKKAQQKTGVEKTIEYIGKSGKRSKAYMTERFSTAEEYDRTGEVKRIGYLKPNGRKSREEIFYVIDKQLPDQILRIVLIYNPKEKLVRKESYYPDPENNSLGYYQSVFLYDAKGRKKREEWYLTKNLIRQEGIKKQVYLYNDKGIVFAQEAHFSAEKSRIDGFSQVAYYFDFKGRKKREERFYSEAMQRRAGLKKQIVYFDIYGYQQKIATYDNQNKLINTRNTTSNR